MRKEVNLGYKKIQRNVIKNFEQRTNVDDVAAALLPQYTEGRSESFRERRSNSQLCVVGANFSVYLMIILFQEPLGLIDLKKYLLTLLFLLLFCVIKEKS